MKLTRLEKDWAMYDWANSVYSMIITTVIFPIYLKSVATTAGFSDIESTAIWGYSNAVVTLLVAMFSPFLGAMADYMGFKKRFFLAFLALGITTTALLGFIPEDQFFLLIVCFIFTSIGFSGSIVFYDAFIVDVTLEERSDRVSAYGYSVGYLGSTLPFILAMVIIYLSSDGVLPFSINDSYRISFIIAAIWWFVFSIPMIKSVNQVFGIPREDKMIRKSAARLFSTFKNIKEYKAPFLFLLAYFFYIDGVDTIIRMATTYGLDLGISQSTILIVLLVTQFIAAPSTMVHGYLTSKMHPKKVIYISILVYLIICTYAFFMSTELDFWILAILVGLVQGGIQSISRSYFSRIVPKEKINEFFGLFNIFGKFAAIMGPILVATVTLMTGRTQSGAFSIIFLFLIGGALLSRVKDESVI